MTRQILAVILAAVLLLAAGNSSAEEAWLCPTCGNEASGNFCSSCGTARDTARADSEDGEAAGAETGVRLDLYVSFEKNAYLSTYDVKLFLDDEWITTLRHGMDFEGSLTVAPGKHVISFEKDTNASVKGMSLISVTESSAYFCGIHARYNTVQIMDERLVPVSPEDPLPGGDDFIRVDGDYRLAVTVEFDRNALLSTYDVDFYADDIKVAALSHGKNYTGTIGLSEGKHYLSFRRADNSSVRGTAEVTVSGDGSFSCHIMATRNRIRVTKETVRQPGEPYQN